MICGVNREKKLNQQKSTVKADPNRMRLRVLVTGGCGFVGSHLVESLLDRQDVDMVVNADRLDECSSQKNHPISANGRYTFLKIDLSILKVQDICSTIRDYGINVILHTAASTFVDASFENGILIAQNYPFNRMIHISTDEVLGDSTLWPVPASQSGAGSRPLTLNPTNPYAASKAAAECIIRAYQISFQLPVIIVRSSNIYGPRQYPEKVVPNFVLRILRGQPLLIHGDGTNLRSYLHVKDFCQAVHIILANAPTDGTVFCCVGENEISVNEIATKISRLISSEHDGLLKSSSSEHMVYVKDRVYNDKRYVMDGSLARELGWRPLIKFDDGLRETIEWFRNNGTGWWDHL